MVFNTPYLPYNKNNIQAPAALLFCPGQSFSGAQSANLDSSDFQPSLRDWIIRRTDTQDFILGYFQPVLSKLGFEAVRFCISKQQNSLEALPGSVVARNADRLMLRTDLATCFRSLWLLSSLFNELHSPNNHLLH
jgi:hypothetical protein